MRTIKHCTGELPEGYREYETLDLQRDRKAALQVNGAGVILMVLLGFGMHRVVPIATAFTLEEGWFLYLLRFLVLIGGTFVYVVLHELTHGAVMKAYGAQKVRFGFTGIYAFAGSDEDYFDRYSYVRVALAPVILWGIILLIINLLVPLNWFWVVYFIQIVNISGSAGDLYVTLRFSRLPQDILIRDTGVAMTVYGK